jgi:uncharacterized protein YmfQ (DUF2313 family)
VALLQTISRTLKRLYIKGIPFGLPAFGKALFDGLSAEFSRVDDLKNKVKNSVVPNDNMSADTIDDYEKRYGVNGIWMLSNQERIQKIIAKASENGSGGPDWLEDLIQASGFDLYVIVNQPDSESTFPQYGDFQYGDVQYGGLVSYTDPRNIDGELIASSPVSNLGGLYLEYGDFQYGDVQYGTIQEGTSYPRPKPFIIPSDPDRWGYVFFVSPFEDRLAGPSELAQIQQEEYDFLVNLILESKFTRNWCILQAESV